VRYDVLSYGTVFTGRDPETKPTAIMLWSGLNGPNFAYRLVAAKLGVRGLKSVEYCTFREANVTEPTIMRLQSV